MSDDDLPTPLQSPITWLDPFNYPTRVTDELAVRIATAIARGVDWRTAGMQAGVAPSRLRKWLKWGEAAYHEDADGTHRHASYLNLFLKVMQAAGLVGAVAQNQSFVDNPAWWLMHNPDQRSAWGQQALPQEPLETTTIEVDDVTPAPAQTYTAEDKRQILRTLIAAGAAVAPSELATDTVDADPAENREQSAG